jgi:hypothetical protein
MSYIQTKKKSFTIQKKLKMPNISRISHDDDDRESQDEDSYHESDQEDEETTESDGLLRARKDADDTMDDTMDDVDESDNEQVKLRRKRRALGLFTTAMANMTIRENRLNGVCRI